MGDMEEVPGDLGDVTNNAFRKQAPGEMERGISQDPLEISRAIRTSVFTA
jgi:hypothetical protein